MQAFHQQPSPILQRTHQPQLKHAMLHATAFEDATGGILAPKEEVIYSNGAMLHATAFEDATGGSWL